LYKEYLALVEIASAFDERANRDTHFEFTSNDALSGEVIGSSLTYQHSSLNFDGM
jgi:hypothetical protein